MSFNKTTKPLLLFYILVAYVLIQFSWWTYLLIKLNNEVTTLQTELVAANTSSSEARLIQESEVLNKKLHKQWLMIFGEGSVFLVLLILGIARTRNAFIKESEINRKQNNFLLSVTHELKSPLASIQLQLETIQHRSLSADQQHAILSGALDDTKRLHSLVENILVTARIDNHSYTLQKESFDINTELQSITDSLQKGSCRNHQLHTQFAKTILIAADRLAFHSIITNLLENAAKYAPANSIIRLDTITSSEHIRIVIADEGKGIPVAEREKIFERFYRIGNEETRSSKGTGLGLYIVKELVEAHGWKIAVGNAPKQGTTFTITLPKHN
jgi:two-component system phosphate regulon sensor histidine kinase PhoR